MATEPSKREATLSRQQFDLPVVVERHAGQPLSVQLGRQLRDAMNDGRVRAGERLPSSRALASALGVSRTVVTAAYEQLYAEGWLEGRHGSGTYVADIAPVESAKETRGRPDRPADVPAIDLRPGIPWVAGLDTPAWRRAWRLAASGPRRRAAGAARPAGAAYGTGRLPAPQPRSGLPARARPRHPRRHERPGPARRYRPAARRPGRRRGAGLPQRPLGAAPRAARRWCRAQWTRTG